MKKYNCFTFFLLLSACAVGPDYVRPTVNTPMHYKEAPKGWKYATPQDEHARGPWWEIFHDTLLNDFETELNKSNQTIANAAANYQQALALLEKSGASFFPTLSGAVSLARAKGSTSTASTTTSTSINTSHSIAFNASWEPDVWGLVRRTIEANLNNAQASAALLAATQLSEQALLAQTYFELRTLDSDQKLLDATVENNKKILNLTQNQYNAGVAERSAVLQAESTLESSETQALNNQMTRAQYEHAIAVLLGKSPAEFCIAQKPLHATPPEIPLHVPSELLERRPDLAQAERTMAANNAEIGVAVSAYFPTFTLSGAQSTYGVGPSHLLGGPLSSWSLGTELFETIFDAGARGASLDAAKAAYEASVATYRQTVLSAFQDVEDNLVSVRILKQEADAQNKAALHAKQAFFIVLNQYKSGTVTYADVLTAENAAFAAEKSARDIAGLRMTSSVALIKAVGGSW